MTTAGRPAPPRGLIGVVHLPAMPGDPAYRAGGFAEVLESATRDAEALMEGGADALIVENFGSAPFPKGTAEQPTPPHQIALLTLAVRACQAVFEGSVGVNVLRNDVRSALGIAAATGAGFVRVNIHVGAYVTDQGLIEGRAFETLRYRDSVEARDVAILADVQVKHATPLAPIDVTAEVKDVLLRGMADAVVVTGRGTGEPVSEALLSEVSEAAGAARVVIGSGLHQGNVSLARLADAAIVGTSLKYDGRISNAVDPARVRALVGALSFSCGG